MCSALLLPKKVQLLNRISKKEWKTGKGILTAAAVCFINTDPEINICGSLHTLE